MVTVSAPADVAQLRAIVGEVPDPEVPVLTIEDLGVLRDVVRLADGSVEVTITPTYSGCPAMDTIAQDIRGSLAAHGVTDVVVRTVLAPAWTTDWMSEDGRRKLAEYGIAPPQPGVSARFAGAQGRPLPIEITPRCPQCGSADVRLLSRFGSTACKALYTCRSCSEPFDHFKAI